MCASLASRRWHRSSRESREHAAGGILSDVTSTSDRLSAALTGRYRIERELGAGGMATVYLAEDLKHDRKVAIKVLKPELAAVLGSERFVVEIKTTAAMSHPHILPLFDSGTADGFLFYVMPYIQGETIRERLNRETQLGVDEAVRIAREVADALDYAHRSGVIHRDIKPENILLHDGRAMVMDFGIALAVSAAAGGRMTETGLSLGTPHYMSPEQATAEKEITGRSDQYSLASVLYEMLAGDPPFTATAAQAVIMKIITEPATRVTERRKNVPANVDAALGKALEKLPADRFESAKAFADALANPHFTAATGAAALAAGTTRQWIRSRYSQLALVALALLAALQLWQTTRTATRPAGSDPVMAFLVRDSMDFAGSSVALADDGTLLMMSGRILDKVSVWRPGDLTPTVVPLPYRASELVLSPDGKRVAFSDPAGGRKEIRLLTLATGASMAISAEIDSGGRPVPLAWDRSGVIVVRQAATANTPGMLGVVADTGGAIRPVAPFAPLQVAVLPGGRALIACTFGRGSGSRLLAVDLATGDTTGIADNACTPRWSPTGHVLATTPDGRMMAFPFDVRRLRASGQPVEVLQSVATNNTGASVSALSSNGTLVYIRGQSRSTDLRQQFVWLDTSGRQAPLTLAPDTVGAASVSPDGRSLLYQRRDGIWSFDLELGTRRHLVVGDEIGGLVLSPGGDSVAYLNGRRIGSGEIRVRALQGDTTSRRLDVPVPSPAMGISADWLPDGNIVVSNARDILSVSANGASPAKPLLAADWSEHTPHVSPNGRWLAFRSNEGGRMRLLVRSWPGLQRLSVIDDSVTNVSPTSVAWSPDSRVLYYQGRAPSGLVFGPRWVKAAFLAGTDSLRVVRRKVITEPLEGTLHGLHPDGRRLLMTRRLPQAADTSVLKLVAVTGWLTQLRQQLGAPVGR